MSQADEKSKKGTLSLGNRGKLGLKKNVDAEQVRQSFSHGRSKSVTVEVKKRRGAPAGPKPDAPHKAGRPAEAAPAVGEAAAAEHEARKDALRGLTEEERQARIQALEQARQEEELRAEEAARKAVEAEEAVAARRAEGGEDMSAPDAEGSAAGAQAEATDATGQPLDAEALRQRELEQLKAIQSEEARKAELAEADAAQRRQEQERERQTRQVADQAGQRAAANLETREGEAPGRGKSGRRGRAGEEREGPGRGKSGRRGRPESRPSFAEERGGRRSALRRRHQRNKAQSVDMPPAQKITREVVIPETISVQELANRMAERGGDVVKALMKLGVMVTINQSLDADTAELVVGEFGHKVKRVSESDVETGLEGPEDSEAELASRAPVVTVMGHVDHGKTSLLDAIRTTDVVAGEAGGITQHIGAYQVQLGSGQAITFIDTPGHAAFTEMRSRGANVTDVVVLVVAANDGIMPQTVEAINHAKAAGAPIVVAINKCDLPDADPDRVRNELLQHEIVVEAMSGETQDVEVSAKTGAGLDKLEEAILLQAELQDLKANPDRQAVGAVVEAKMERGRGVVATVLIQHGTLNIGDTFVAGAESGRVRAMTNDRGQEVESAGPSVPVEVLGFDGAPEAGDRFTVVEDEARAREVAEFRQRRKREALAAQQTKAAGNLEQLFAQAKEGEKSKLDVVIKADVHGSCEAVAGALTRLVEESEELEVRVLHTGVGAINESDIQLARASKAMLVGFNVRANPQARDMARRDGVDIRYYSVIYNIIDDVKQILSGMLSPEMREEFLGYAEIREVFTITKVGKVAGCRVTEGVVRRGAQVRLLRDNVVIHEGKLKTLKRFKDDVQEVRQGYECGMAFENYDDMRQGDVIEAFEYREIQREL